LSGSQQAASLEFILILIPVAKAFMPSAGKPSAGITFQLPSAFSPARVARSNQAIIVFNLISFHFSLYVLIP
jgi:hypothetical protein